MSTNEPSRPDYLPYFAATQPLLDWVVEGIVYVQYCQCSLKERRGASPERIVKISVTYEYNTWQEQKAMILMNVIACS